MASTSDVSVQNSPFFVVYAVFVTFYHWLKDWIFGAVSAGAVNSRLISSKEDKNVAREEIKTPEESFRLQISKNLFEEALEIAEQNNFDTDEVYKAQWLSAPVDSSSISKYLRKVRDLKWVINETSCKIGESPEICKCLLEYGLECLEKMETVEIPNNECDNFAKIEQMRNRLNNCLGRLEDYETCILFDGSDFDKKLFGKICSYTSLDLAVYFAKTNCFFALKILMQSRNDELFKYWLFILDHICETVDVKSYEFLLPCETHHHTYCITHSSPGHKYGSKVNSDLAEFQSNFCETANQQPYEFILPVENSLDLNVVSKWYEYRAEKIDNLTGMPDLAENLLKVAVQNLCLDNLSTLLDDYKFLRLLAYSRTQGNFIGYKKFSTSQPMEVADEFLRNTNDSDMGRLIVDVILPYFVHCQMKSALYTATTTFSQHHVLHSFRDLVLSRSTASLKPLLSILRHLENRKGKKRDGIDFSSIDFLLNQGDDDYLLALVRDCFDRCQDQSVDFLDVGSEIAKLCSSTRFSKVRVSESKILTNLHKNLRALNQLRVLYGVFYTYEQFKLLCYSEKDSTMLLKRLSRKHVADALDQTSGATTGHVSRISKSQPFQLDHWRSTLHSMNSLRDAVLETLTPQHCTENLVEALLCSGDERLIKIAAFFIETSSDSSTDTTLPVSVGKQLTLACGLSYINESVSAYDKALDCAKLCFKLLNVKQLPDDVQRELDFLDALPLLDSLGFKDLPLRLRLHADKSTLIDRAFELNGDFYADFRTVEKLCRLLRVPDDDITHVECYALRRCAEQAFSLGDHSVCSSYCNRIFQSPQGGSSWRVCRTLARDPAYVGAPSEKRRLLAFSAAFCDTDELASTLTDLAAIDDELFVEQARGVSEPDEDDSAAVDNEVILKWIDATRDPHKKEQVIDQCRLDELQANCSTWDHSKMSSLHSVENLEDLVNCLKFLLRHQTPENHFALHQLVEILSRRALPCDPLFAHCLTLNFNRVDAIQRLQRHLQFCSSPLYLELTLYLTCLAYLRRKMALGSVSTTRRFLTRLCYNIQPRRLIGEVEKVAQGRQKNHDDDSATIDDDEALELTFTKCAEQIDSASKNRFLTALPEGLLDNRRFQDDEEYRKETILGFALSYEESSYLTAVQLAEKFGVDEWEVFWAHLTFMFSESDPPVTLIQDFIKRRHLLELLAGRPSTVAQRISRDIFPLLDGRNFQLMSLYYLIVEKLCNGQPVAKHAQINRNLLRYLSKYAPGVDFKKLVSDDTDALDAISPFMDATNFSALAKILIQIPTKTVTLEDTLSLWARKVFIKTCPKISFKAAFEKCSSILQKLTVPTYLDFVRGILFGDQADSLYKSDVEQYAVAEICFDFAVNNKKFTDALNDLELLKNSLLTVCDKFEPNQSKIEKSVPSNEFDQLVDQAKLLLQQGHLQEAGCILINAYQVPPSMRTYNTSMYLVEKLKSSMSAT